MWNGLTELAFVVMPFLLVIAFVLRRKSESQLRGADVEMLNQAQVQTRRLEERVDHLERILDEDVPGWRTRATT